MSDIVFTRKLGDSSVTKPQVSGAATAATGTVSNLPTALTNEAVGTLIKALVASQTNRGLTTLQTDKGTLTFQTNVPLRIGNELVLQLQSTGAQSRALILSVDGKPIAEGGLTKPSGSGGQSPTGGQGLGKFTTAVGGQPPHSRIGTGQGFIRAPGNGNGGKVINPTNAVSGQDVHSNFRTDIRGPVSPGLVLPAQVVTTGTGTEGNGFKFTAGDMLTVRILGLAPESIQKLQPLLPPVGPNTQILQGQVAEANTASASLNQAARPTLVTLDAGRLVLVLAASPPGPSGTQIMFEVLESHPPIARGGDNPLGAYRDFLVLGTDWQSLKQALNLVTMDSTAPTATDIGPAIARPGPQMASAMLFFMAALRAGDIHAWFGDAGVEKLARLNQGQTLNRLGEDFSLMSRHAGDALGTGWHSLAVPIETRHGIEQFRLYYRKQASSQDGQDDEATHFVVEADLSHFGLFQLEGLVRSHQFDLIVHSTQSLPSEMQGTIKGIYQESLNIGDLIGTIRFNGGMTKPFNPTEGINPHTDDPTGHIAVIVV